MSCYLARVIASLLLLGLATAVQAQTVIKSDKASVPVNLRAEPSEASARIGQLLAGEQLQLIQNEGRWRQVRLNDGTTGFVSRRWTRLLGDLPERQQDELRIHFLSIGAGTCTVVECPGASANPLIYDCGSTGGIGPRALDPDSTAEKVKEILSGHSASPDVIASHGDQDHYSYLSSALDDVQARSVWLGGMSSSFDGFGFPDWLARQEAGGAVIHKDLGRHWNNDESPLAERLDCGLADVYVLTNSSHDVDQSNDPDNADTLMLMIEYEEFSTIFSGDAEGETEARSSANFGDTLHTTVLMSSHHGASTHGSNSDSWANATKPDVVIFSAGTRFQHPRCSARARYMPHLRHVREHDIICDTNSAGINTLTSTGAEYMTHVSGTIVVTTNGQSPLHLWCENGAGCDAYISY